MVRSGPARTVPWNGTSDSIDREGRRLALRTRPTSDSLTFRCRLHLGQVLAMRKSVGVWKLAGNRLANVDVPDTTTPSTGDTMSV